MESAENREQSPQVNQPEESNDSPTLSKTETIKLLNDSIDQLESTIKDISKNSAQKLPSSDSIETLLNTTQELADSVAPPPPEPTPSPAPVAEIPPESTTSIPAPATAQEKPASTVKSQPEKLPVEEKNKIEGKNKTVVKNKKQENRGLTIIGIIAVAIAVIAVIWLWIPQNTNNVSLVSEPTTTEIVDPQPTIAPENNQNSQTNKIPGQSEDSPVAADTSEPETEEPEQIAIPQELVSPGKASNLKIETIEPELTFTPEQSLVATLQTKLAELTADYDPDLFNSVRVDLPNSSLMVEVTDKWYQLNESRQDKFANELLKRSRKFDFGKLELRDTAGTLVARNPVVGDRAILIQTTTVSSS